MASLEDVREGARVAQRPLTSARQTTHRRWSFVTTADRVVFAGATAYAVVFVLAAAAHFFAFQSGLIDLGYMAQAVWSTAHGHLLEATSAAGGTATRLGGHVDPILVLLVPLWWVWHSPLLLAVVQALAVATGAFPVYWLGRKHLGSSRAAAHFAFAYLLYPATQFNAFTISSGFHAVSLAVPLILFAIWFLDEDRLVLFAVFALLAASTKEEIPAAVGCLGIWYAVRKGKRLAGLSIFVLGLAVSLVEFQVIIPHFSASGVDPFAHRYSSVGSTPGGILHKAFTDPGAFLHAVASTHKLIYVILLFVPFLGLWALEPLLLLGAGPDLAINLLSSKHDQTSIPYHWTAGIIPFVVAASIFGAARLKRDPTPRSLAVLVVILCIALYSPLYFFQHDVRLALPNPTRSAKVHALSLIPQAEPVTASVQLGGYLSSRREIYVFPNLRNAHWAIVDRNDPSYDSVRRSYARAVARIDSDTSWHLVYSSHGIQVLRRPIPEAR